MGEMRIQISDPLSSGVENAPPQTRRVWEYQRRHLWSKVAFHNGSVALVDQGIVSGTNFITSLVIARVCGKSELGLYLLAWTVAVMLNELLIAAITTPYVVMSPTLSSDAQTSYRGSALVHQFVLSLLAMVSLGAAGLTLRSSKPELAHLLLILACLVAVLIFKEFTRRLWFAHLEMRAALAADAGASFLQLALLGFLAKAGFLNSSSAYLAVAAAAVIPCCLWIKSYKRRVSIGARRSIQDFRRNWALARWIAGSGFLWAAAMYVYPWLLLWTHGTSETGIWAACYGLVAMGNPVLLGFGNYLGPKIALLRGHEGLASMSRYVFSSSGRFVALLLPLVVIVWVAGDALVGHLYGAAFVGHITVIRILAINVLISGAVFPFSRGFFVLQKAHVDLAVNVVAVLLLFVFGIGLVRSQGSVGAAIGLTATNGLTALLRVIVFRHLTNPSVHVAECVSEQS